MDTTSPMETRPPDEQPGRPIPPRGQSMRAMAARTLPRFASPGQEIPSSPDPSSESLPNPNRVLDGERSVGAAPPDPRTGSFSAGKWRPGGDPIATGAVLGGLLVAGLKFVQTLARRRGRDFRMPSPGERDDISQPLGRILVRHLPMDLIGPDLHDIALAASAVHSYALADPLLPPYVPELPPHGLDEL